MWNGNAAIADAKMEVKAKILDLLSTKLHADRKTSDNQSLQAKQVAWVGATTPYPI
jgi:hypothetical protein